MQIRCFPTLEFHRTFSMMFWRPHRKSLWPNILYFNLFQVKPYFAWTNIALTKQTQVRYVCISGTRGITLKLDQFTRTVPVKNCSDAVTNNQMIHNHIHNNCLIFRHIQMLLIHFRCCTPLHTCDTHRKVERSWRKVPPSCSLSRDWAETWGRRPLHWCWT